MFSKNENYDLHSDEFMTALVKRDLEKMKALGTGANFNAPKRSFDWLNGRTILHQAITLGGGICVEFVLCDYPNMNFSDRTSNDNIIQVLDWMLEQGADINARDNFGYTPLQLALYEGKHISCIDYLCSKKSNLYNIAAKGYTSDKSTSVFNTAQSGTRINYIDCLFKHGYKFTDEDLRGFIRFGISRSDFKKDAIRNYLIELTETNPTCFSNLSTNMTEYLDKFLSKNMHYFFSSNHYSPSPAIAHLAKSPNIGS